MEVEVWRSFWPKKAPLTEQNLSDQAGKVFIVTGASSGVGEKLAQILYQHNATVYIATRSEKKANEAIARIRKDFPLSKGRLVFLHLDLGDLTTIKTSALAYLAQEATLDTIWLNAGVMFPPQGSKTVQGYELQLGTNNIGHFLYLRYLLPCLRATAKIRPPASVRVIWVSSSAIANAPSPPIDFDNMNYEVRDEGGWTKYARSKAGNVLHAVEFGRKCEEEGNGIISVSLHPGLLRTDLQRGMPSWQAIFAQYVLSRPPIYGAYTELYAGLSDEITEKNQGAFIVPWGSMVQTRQDLWDQSLGRNYWAWTEEQVKGY